jgi:hypothetical protein
VWSPRYIGISTVNGHCPRLLCVDVALDEDGGEVELQGARTARRTAVYATTRLCPRHAGPPGKNARRDGGGRAQPDPKRQRCDEKVIKRVLDSRTSDDGEVMYKVRYAGLNKSADEWLEADVVSEEHIAKGCHQSPKTEQGDRPCSSCRDHGRD